MSAHIFDGKAFAAKEEQKLVSVVNILKSKGITPKLVTLNLTNDPASKLYLNLKRKAAERVGCKLLVVNLKSLIKPDEVIKQIQKFNKDKSTHGIMIQMPFPKDYSEEDKEKIIDSIIKEKDVDGMCGDSSFIAPVVLAIESVLVQAGIYKGPPRKLVVVGADGFVGKKMVRHLKVHGHRVSGVDIDTVDLANKTAKADVLISATGIAGLIKPSMVKDGVVLIDVGAPKGDIDESTHKKAVFVSPSPGGVGPVTITKLIRNLTLSF